MKESITKFDLEAAFKALDEIDIPKAEKGIKANKPALTEIFSHKSKFDALLEEYYDIGNQTELSDAKEAREAEVAKAKLARIEKIVDLDADSPEDLLTSYVGKFIIQCPQFMTLFYKNPEDVEESEEDPTAVNVNEVCQHCGNESGYTLIGKVGEASPEESTEVPEESQDDLEPDELSVDETSEEDTENATASDDLDFDLDSDLEELDLEIEDDEEEKKEESFVAHTGEALVEDVQDNKELDAKLEAHNEYIEYLRAAIVQEETTLEKTDNEQVKAAIQRRIDAFKADLESALPDEVKNNLTTTEEPSEETSVEAEEAVVIEEALTEALREDADLDVSADEFEELINSPEFKKPISDSTARAMINTENEETSVEESLQEGIFDSKEKKQKAYAELINKVYGKGYQVVANNFVTAAVGVLNNASAELEREKDESQSKGLAKNFIIAIKNAKNTINKLPRSLVKSIYDYGSKCLTLFNNTCNELDDLKELLSLSTKLQNADKIGPKAVEFLFENINKTLNTRLDMIIKKIKKDFNIIESFEEPAIDNSEDSSEVLDEGAFDKLKDKFADVADKVTSKLKSREAKADWILQNARKNYDNLEVDDKGELVPDEDNQKFKVFLVIGYKDRYSNGKKITTTPSHDNKDLVMGMEKPKAFKTYQDAANSAGGWSMRSGNGPAFVYLTGGTDDDKMAFLCQYVNGEVEDDQVEKYFGIVKNNIKGAKKEARGNKKNVASEESSSKTDIKTKEATVSEIKQGMKIKVGEDSAEVTKVADSRFGKALTVKYTSGETETLTFNKEATMTVIVESFDTSLTSIMESLEELQEASLEELISDSLIEAYGNVAGFRLTGCTYLNEKFTVDGTIYFTSGNTRKTTYSFSEAFADNDKITLCGLNEKLGLDKQFNIIGHVEDKIFITESFNQNKK